MIDRLIPYFFGTYWVLAMIGMLLVAYATARKAESAKSGERRAGAGVGVAAGYFLMAGFGGFVGSALIFVSTLAVTGVRRDLAIIAAESALFALLALVIARDIPKERAAARAAMDPSARPALPAPNATCGKTLPFRLEGVRAASGRLSQFVLRIIFGGAVLLLATVLIDFAQTIVAGRMPSLLPCCGSLVPLVGIAILRVHARKLRDARSRRIPLAMEIARDPIQPGETVRVRVEGPSVSAARRVVVSLVALEGDGLGRSPGNLGPFAWHRVATFIPAVRDAVEGEVAVPVDLSPSVSAGAFQRQWAFLVRVYGDRPAAEAFRIRIVHGGTPSIAN